MKGLARIFFGLLLCVIVQTGAPAAEYPERSIRLLVGLGPGSPPDLITRAVSERLQTLLGQLVVVENRVGATGVIALQALVNQNADGYTLLLLPSPTVAVLSLYPDVRVNFATDIAPIGQIERDYNVLVVGNQSPAKSVAELIALLKQQPGKVNNASGGFGTPAHLIGELFKKETGTSATHVPYTQFPQAVVDVISGRIEFMIMGASVAVPQVQGGKLRALGVTSPARLRSFRTSQPLPSLVSVMCQCANGWDWLPGVEHRPRSSIGSTKL